MGITEVFCIIFSFMSMFFDLKWEKVPNFWNLCGILTAIILYGVKLERIIGAIIPLVVLFILFKYKMIGTGDVKVFMVLGYVMELEKISRCMLYSFLIGACISVPILLCRCDFRQRFIYFFTYLKTVLETGTIQPYLVPGKTSENTHFTIFIFCSVILLSIQGGYL